MPVYEYRCRNCDHQFEAQQAFSDDPLTDCPECHGVLRKVFSPVGIAFKGSGFYKNDSRPGSSSSTGSSGDGSDSSGSTGSGDKGSGDSSTSGTGSNGSGSGGDAGTSSSGSGSTAPAGSSSTGSSSD